MTIIPKIKWWHLIVTTIVVALVWHMTELALKKAGMENLP